MANYRLRQHKPNKNGDKRLYLTEGILKPYIAHYLHDIAICGAGGGYFSGSPKQVAEIVSDYDEIAIAPDGGDVLNPQVMNRWQKQINFLKRFNKTYPYCLVGAGSKNPMMTLMKLIGLLFQKPNI